MVLPMNLRIYLRSGGLQFPSHREKNCRHIACTLPFCRHFPYWMENRINWFFFIEWISIFNGKGQECIVVLYYENGNLQYLNPPVVQTQPILALCIKQTPIPGHGIQPPTAPGSKIPWDHRFVQRFLRESKQGLKTQVPFITIHFQSLSNYSPASSIYEGLLYHHNYYWLISPIWGPWKWMNGLDPIPLMRGASNWWIFVPSISPKVQMQWKLACFSLFHLKAI